MEEIVDFLRDSEALRAARRARAEGDPALRPAGNGEDPARQGGRPRVRRELLLAERVAFVEMFAGLGAARIRKLFEEARKHAPAIVFIDELDAVGTARTGLGFNREQDQTLNQLLVELDGFGDREQVVVMGASNRLQDLDPALLRPGRFDRQILVSPPDLAGREAILHVHTRGKPLAADVDLPSIARQTAGLTGADLANIANEAAIFAGREKQQYIHQAHFDDALERIIAGLQQRKVMSEKEKRILAYHEGGHALMSHLMGDVFPVQKATIVPRGNALGYTFNLPEEERFLHTREEFIDWMKIALAGRAAEQVVFGRVTNGAANDLEKVTELARSMVFEYGMSEGVVSRTMRADNYALSEETKRVRDQEQARLTDDAYQEAVRLITKHRAALDRLARRCSRRRRSFGTRCRRCSPTSSRSPARARPSARSFRSSASKPTRPSGRSPRAADSISRVQAKGIHHLGVAVEDLDEAVDTYRAPLRRRARAPRHVEAQGVEAAALRVGESRVELVASLGDETPVGKFLASAGRVCTTSPTRWPTCGASSKSWPSRASQLIDEEPHEGLFGLEVAFVHPDSVHGVLAEVVASG